MDLSNLLKGVQPTEDTSNSKSALPQGDYNVMIEKADPKTNKDSGNKGINLQLRVKGNKYNNYVLFDYMGLTGSKEQLSYSLPKLKKLGVVCDSEDTSTWIGKEVKIAVSIDKKDETGTRNIIWGYGQKFVEDNTPISNGVAGAFNSTDIPF